MHKQSSNNILKAVGKLYDKTFFQGIKKTVSTKPLFLRNFKGIQFLNQNRNL